MQAGVDRVPAPSSPLHFAVIEPLFSPANRAPCDDVEIMQKTTEAGTTKDKTKKVTSTSNKKKKKKVVAVEDSSGDGQPWDDSLCDEEKVCLLMACSVCVCLCNCADSSNQSVKDMCSGWSFFSRRCLTINLASYLCYPCTIGRLCAHAVSGPSVPRLCGGFVAGLACPCATGWFTSTRQPCRSNACTRATAFIATAQLPNVTAHVIARNREETTAEDAARRHRKAGSTDWLLLPAVLRQANDVAARKHVDRRAAAF